MMGDVQHALRLTSHDSWFANISLLKSDLGFHFFLAVMKEGSDCCKLRLKASDKDKEVIQEVITSLAPAKGISMDAASSIIRKKNRYFHI